MDDSDKGGGPAASGRGRAAPDADRRHGQGPPGGQDQPLAHQVPPGAHVGGVIAGLVAIGVLRPRTADGELGPRSLEGPLRVPRHDLRDRDRVDVGPRRAARQRRGARHVRARRRAARRRAPHHVAVHDGLLDDDPHAELHDVVARRATGRKGNADDAVAVLGQDGGSAHRQRHGAVPRRPGEGDRRVPQPRDQLRRRDRPARRRAAASASCSRSTTSSTRATSAGHTVEDDVAHVHEGQAGIRRVCSSRTSSSAGHARASRCSRRVDAKVAAQQKLQQQEFD